MSAGPMALWRDRMERSVLAFDSGQASAVEKLQLLHQRLSGYTPRRAEPRRRGFRLFGRGDAVAPEAPEGLYLYGGVGRGKSMLMDLFFEGAPLARRRRVHFHAFMQEVQAGIHAARESGVEDPIKIVAAEVAESAALLCFDEIEVRDIADAMILGRLFEALFNRGVVVVATSNRHPDELYKNGLNRQLFLPFIALLKERMDLHHIADGADHRGREALPHWVAPLGAATAQRMDQIWEALTGEAEEAPLEIADGSRRLELPRAAAGCARAGFPDLCDKPLGVRDFLKLAEAVEALMIEDIPLLGRGRGDQTRRFVLLVDVFYEAKRPLFCSAAASPEGLCAEGDWAFEFERTASRLGEMTAPGWPRQEETS